MALLKMWDGIQWVVAPSGAVVGIDDLSDVTLTSAADNDFLQRKSDLWVNRTPAQALADLGAQPLDSDLTTIAAMSGADGSFIGRSGGAFALRSAANTKVDLSLDKVLNIKHNFSSAVPPTVSDDNTQGYAVGSRWVDTLTHIMYYCASATTGAALWIKVNFISSVASPLVESGGGLSLPAAAGPSTNGYLTGADKAKIDVLAMSRIASTILGADAASVVFSSIPATFSHLRLVVLGRSVAVADSDDLYVRCNGDSAANYGLSIHFWSAAISAPTGVQTLSTSAGMYAGGLTAANSVSGEPGFVQLDIADYTRTTFRKVSMGRSIMFRKASPEEIETLALSQWRSTAAITSLTVYAGAGNLLAGSRFDLYGIL